MTRMRGACLAALLAGLTLAPAVGAPADGLEVTGWILGSGSVAQVDRNASGLSTLSVDGLQLHGRGTTGVDRRMRRLARRGHHDGLSTELLVSNYSNRLGDFDPAALHRLLSSPGRVRAVARAVARVVDAGPWDGANVDFEQVRRGDAAGLASFVRRLQADMPGRRTVSIDVSAGTSGAAYRDQGYALRALGRAADVVDLMAYDDHGPTWTGPGPIGPLPWQRRSLAALLHRVPARRVHLGVAGYGYTWPRQGTGRSLTDAGARRLVRRDGTTARWSARAGEWSATLSDGTVVWWSDRRSYRLRQRLARASGVRGLAVWRVGSADRLR